MAPWPELENAQPNPNKFIDGAPGPQSNIEVKDKEPSQSKCSLPSGDRPHARTHRELALAPHGLYYLFEQMKVGLL